MRLELTPFRIHSPALWPVELQPPCWLTRPRQGSNLRLRGLQPRAFPLGDVVENAKHAGQGSNLSLPVLETGVPPLELPACVARVRREGFEPPSSPWGFQGYSLMQSTALPPARIQNSQRGRIRTFDLVRPRHARCQTAPHAESKDEGGRMKDGGRNDFFNLPPSSFIFPPSSFPPALPEGLEPSFPG